MATLHNLKPEKVVKAFEKMLCSGEVPVLIFDNTA